MRAFPGPLAVVLLLCGAADARPLPGAIQTLEYEVKAAYLFNLVNASEWPAAAFPSANAPFRLCVADPNPFGRALSQTFQNEQVGGHPVAVATVKTPQEVGGCHVLFVSDASDPTGALTDRAAASAVLTVGENRGFATRGGIITFVLDDGRIRFDVNQHAASRAGIKLSSKVLRVARQIS